MNHIYFGTRERMGWFKPPAVDTPLSKTGTANVGTDVNGGGYAKLSPVAHRDYTFTWGASPAQDIYDITDYRSGVYGTGLLYYLDPFAMRNNVLPDSFSMPRTLCDIGKVTGTVSNATGSRTVSTNLLTNPSFESSSGTVVVYRNLASNPRGVTAVGGWGAYSAGATATLTSTTHNAFTSVGLPFNSCVKYEFTTASNVSGGGIYINGQSSAPVPIPVAVGSVYYASAYVTSNVDVTIVPALEWKGDGTGTISTSAGTPVVITAGVARRVDVVATAPAGAVNLAVSFYRQGSSTARWQAGDQLFATGGMVVVVPSPVPYFDGAFSQDSDLTPSWVGVANASASILSGAGLAGLAQIAGRASIQSEQWASRGAKSARVIRTGTARDAAGGLVAWTSTSAHVGKTFTARAIARIPSGYDSTSDEAFGDRTSRGLFLFTGGDLTHSTQAPAAAGEHHVQLTFTPTAANQTLRLGGGGAIGQSVWWDAVVLVEGTLPDGVEYFDGNNAPYGFTTSWVGPTNNSASIISAPITSRAYTNLPMGLPAEFNNPQMNSPLVLPVPSGYTLWVSYMADASCLLINGNLISPTSPTDTTHNWVAITTPFTEIRWARIGKVNIWGAQAVILPNGETPDPAHRWVLGKGNWGLRFSGEPQISGLSARIGGRDGLVNGSATFKETGLWE